MSTYTFKVVQPETLAEDYYPAVVSEFELVEGQFGQQFKFTFNLLGEHEGKSLVAWCSAPNGNGLSTRSKLYKWARAVLGESWDATQGLDLEWLKGKPVRLNVTVEEKADGTEYNKVAGLAPAKGNSNGQTAAAPQASTKPTAPPPPPANWDGVEF